MIFIILNKICEFELYVSDNFCWVNIDNRSSHDHVPRQLSPTDTININFDENWAKLARNLRISLEFPRQNQPTVIMPTQGKFIILYFLLKSENIYLVWKSLKMCWNLSLRISGKIWKQIIGVQISQNLSKSVTLNF